MSGDTCGRRVGVEKSSRNGILASIRPQSRLILLSVSPRRIPVFPSIKRTRLEWWFPVASVSCSTRSSRAEIAAEIAYSDGIVPIPVFYVHLLSFSLSRLDETSKATNKRWDCEEDERGKEGRWSFLPNHSRGSWMNPFSQRNLDERTRGPDAEERAGMRL